MNHLSRFTLLLLIVIASSCAKSMTSSSLTNNTTNQEEDLRRSYTGEYETRPNENIKIFLEGDELKIQGPGQPVMTLAPTENVNRFYLEKFDVHIEFVKENDAVSKLLMIRFDGQTLEAPKVNQD